MRYEAKDFAAQLQKYCGEVSPEIAWLLVKLSKHARLRMRNNSALNNWFGSAFPHLRFQQVLKRKADGQEYMGLQITWRDSAKQAQIVPEVPEDEEE